MNRILPQVNSCPLWTLTLDEQDIATSSQLSTVDTDIRWTGYCHKFTVVHCGLCALTLDEYDIATSSQLSTMDTDIRWTGYCHKFTVVHCGHCHYMNRILPQVHSCPLWTLTLDEQDIATSSQLSTVDTAIRWIGYCHKFTVVHCRHWH